MLSVEDRMEVQTVIYLPPLNENHIYNCYSIFWVLTSDSPPQSVTEAQL